MIDSAAPLSSSGRASRPTLLAAGTVLNGRYTIEGVIRVGSEGALYYGSDAMAAAKMVTIRETFDPSVEAQTHFRDEVDLLAGLDHPNLPVVIDYFVESSGRQYLVMLHIEGESLTDILARTGGLSTVDALACFDRLLSAVEYLHTQRPPIIHGGISPNFIVIATDGTPHLTDLAGVDNPADPVTRASATGDPYTAPDWYSGWLDERSDIYSLGATFYILLTGREPIPALARTAGESLIAPRRIRANISPLIESAILRAMSLNAEDRFNSVGEFRQALREPVPDIDLGPRPTSRPAPRPKPTSKAKPRPNMRVVLVGGFVLVLCVAVIVVASTLRSLLFPPTDQVARASPTETEIPTATQEPTQAPTQTEVVPTATIAPVVPTEPISPTAVVDTPVADLTPTEIGETPTPQLLSAPRLLAPGNLSGVTGEIYFQWSWDYPLKDDEYFDLQVWRQGTEPVSFAWSQDPYNRAVRLLTGDGEYIWRVRVIRASAGQVDAAISEFSQEYSLNWSLYPPPRP